MIKLLPGDCRDVLATLPAESVQCVVTSPPYYGLRDYQTALWDGGDAACGHRQGSMRRDADRVFPTAGADRRGSFNGGDKQYTDTCGKCGAVRVDRQIGLEATPDEYLATMVGVFREVRRVLRRDGTCWVNMGDSYAGPNNGYSGDERPSNAASISSGSRGAVENGQRSRPGKPKDLLLMPARLALALQAPQHYGPITKETDRAWMAAFMDGEGTISIARNVSAKSRGGEEYCQVGYTPFVTAGNQDVELIERLVEITGCGKVGLKDRPYIDSRQIKSRRDYYGWRVDAKLATAIIRDIYPFLIAKRKQAILAYNLALSNEQGRSLRGNGALPKSEQEKRELLKVLVNACNQRKPVDMPSWLIEPPSNVEQGWWVRSDIIWHKPNPMPESCRDRPTSAHEHVFMLTRSARYFYDAQAVAEPINWPEGSWSRSKAYDGDETGKLRSFYGEGRKWEGGATRSCRNVWTIATHAYPDAHFATFPPELAERCIKAGTRPGDTVLDPFIGAGTTALVADRLQRDVIGIDLNTQYTRMAMDRCIADAPLLADLGPMPEHPEESAMADLFQDMAAD